MQLAPTCYPCRSSPPSRPPGFPNIPAPNGDNGPEFSDCARKVRRALSMLVSTPAGLAALSAALVDGGPRMKGTLFSLGALRSWWYHLHVAARRPHAAPPTPCQLTKATPCCCFASSSAFCASPGPQVLAGWQKPKKGNVALFFYLPCPPSAPPPHAVLRCAVLCCALLQVLAAKPKKGNAALFHSSPLPISLRPHCFAWLPATQDVL